MTLALTRGGIFQDKLADSPERVALWQAPVPRRWPEGGHSLAAIPNLQPRGGGFVFLVKSRKSNLGLERMPAPGSFLKISTPFVVLVYALMDLFPITTF